MQEQEVEPILTPGVARELGRRREGGAAGWCWTHSASPSLQVQRLYQLCPTPRPHAHRVAEHFRCARLGAGLRVSAQHPAMASRWLVRPPGRPRSRSGPCYCIPRRMLAS